MGSKDVGWQNKGSLVNQHASSSSSLPAWGLDGPPFNQQHGKSQKVFQKDGRSKGKRGRNKAPSQREPSCDDDNLDFLLFAGVSTSETIPIRKKRRKAPATQTPVATESCSIEQDFLYDPEGLQGQQLQQHQHQHQHQQPSSSSSSSSQLYHPSLDHQTHTQTQQPQPQLQPQIQAQTQAKAQAHQEQRHQHQHQHPVRVQEGQQQQHHHHHHHHHPHLHHPQQQRVQQQQQQRKGLRGRASATRLGGRDKRVVSKTTTHKHPSKWKWAGPPIETPTFLNEAIVSTRHIYYEKAQCTDGGFVLSLGDGVLLRPPEEESTLCYVARIRGFCEEAASSNRKSVIIEWFFRPEEMKGGRDIRHGKDEVFMKKSGLQVRDYHIDSIDSPCRVLTYPEYCRYRASIAFKKQNNEVIDDPWPVFYAKEWYDNEDNYKSVKRKKAPGRPSKYGLSSDVSGSVSNINKRNTKGETKLHTACIKGHVNDVRHLLRMNAHPNLADNAGWTPFHEACAHDHVEIARILIRTKVDVNHPGPNGVRPIHDAAENGSIEMVRLLLRNQADVDVRDGQGRLPVDLVQPSQINILNLLKQGEGHVRERRAAAVACDEMNSIITQF